MPLVFPILVAKCNKKWYFTTNILWLLVSLLFPNFPIFYSHAIFTVNVVSNFPPTQFLNNLLFIVFVWEFHQIIQFSIFLKFSKVMVVQFWCPIFHPINFWAMLHFSYSFTNFLWFSYTSIWAFLQFPEVMWLSNFSPKKFLGNLPFFLLVWDFILFF